MSCCVAFALAAGGGAAVACNDATGSGPQASSVTGIAGDSQVAPTGAALGIPLSLTVLGSTGQPVQGVRVTWTVIPGGGVTFDATTTPSDVNGVSTTHVTAGSVPDTVIVQAHVPGVAQPVNYDVFVVDPCGFAVVLPFGSSANGVLTTHDCRLGSPPFLWYYDYYAVTLANQSAVTVNMTANFDTYVDFFNKAPAAFIGFNDDISGSNRNSRFEAILPAGEYIIGANTADTLVTGPYNISAAAKTTPITNCQQMWVTRGVVFDDAIAATDCPDTTGTGSYGDSLNIIVMKGTVLRIAQRSTAVNANLRLFQVTFSTDPAQPDTTKLVASNDDSSATTMNAFVSYTVPQSVGGDLALLIIFAGTTGAQTGAYTLDIQSTTTLSPFAESPVSPWALRLGDRVIPRLGKHLRR